MYNAKIKDIQNKCAAIIKLSNNITLMSKTNNVKNEIQFSYNRYASCLNKEGQKKYIQYY